MHTKWLGAAYISCASSPARNHLLPLDRPTKVLRTGVSSQWTVPRRLIILALPVRVRWQFLVFSNRLLGLLISALIVFWPTNDPRRRTLKASLLEVRALPEDDCR
jgi:hypothetical protein